jgi:enhancing lycopene biosynthesis protein 2
MAKRVGVILSGCGHRDGSDVAETMLAFLMLDRAGAHVVCAAPDKEQREVFDHLSGALTPGVPRNARVESARIAPGQVLPLSQLDARAIDALLIPSGHGVATSLSDYAEKGQLCAVDPDLARVLRELLASKRPMAFMGLAAVLAARVLGPVAGVRVTLGAKANTAAKHAAVMGADVRPCAIDEIVVDEKARVFSTPGLEAEGARLAAVARATDKLVRGLLAAAKDRVPTAPRPEAAPAPVAPAPILKYGEQAVLSAPSAPAKPRPGDPVVRRGGATGRARGSA